MKTKILIILLITLGAQNVYSSEKHYHQLKNKVDDYENSVIEEFSFSLPENYSESFSHTEQIKYGKLLEKKFHAQKKLFYSAENGLFDLEQSLPQKVKKGLLSEKEADKLYTSVEYARRIILQSRKTEVIQRYQEFKSKLSIKPSLDIIYSKIQNADLPGRCEIISSNLDLQNEQLEFTVKGLDPNGMEAHTDFVITKQELELGFLTTRFENSNHLGHKEKVIMNYSSAGEDQSMVRFSIFENNKGQLYHAEFYHDHIKKPWFNLWGYDIGYQTIDKKIICGDTEKYSLLFKSQKISHN